MKHLPPGNPPESQGRRQAADHLRERAPPPLVGATGHTEAGHLRNGGMDHPANLGSSFSEMAFLRIHKI